MMAPKAIGLWENPLGCAKFETNGVRPSVVDLCEALSIPLPKTVSSSLAGCYTVAAEFREQVMHHEWVTEGAIYPINPSSLFAAQALGVCADDEVLDLAAAPGGKSLVLASCLYASGEFTGRLALVEPVKPRFHRLRANMARCGVEDADYYLRDGRGVGTAVPERFDRVLLDAPCSSEARFQFDDPRSMSHWSVRKVRECARKQKSLIKSAFRALKPGGTMIYSTCSFAPEENERIVDGLLRREPDARLIPVTLPPDTQARFLPGFTSVPALGDAQTTSVATKAKSYQCGAAVRVVPDALWDGFFLAKIEKARR